MRCVSFLLVACVALAVAFETEDDVIVGTDSNFDDVLKTNEYLLVEFYAPWCGHCKSLAPEYAKAAGLLKEKESLVKLVKVDATIHAKAAERFHVQGYPTLKFFKNGQDSEYSGGRTAKDIVAWLEKRTGPPATTIDTVEKAQSFANANEVVVFGFFKTTEEEAAVAFLEAAESSDNTFAISTNTDVAAFYGVVPPKIIALKKFDDLRADYTGAFEAEAIEEFAAGSQLPYVIEFSDANAPKIFGGPIKSHVLLFSPKSDPKTESYLTALKTVAKANQGKLLFIHLDTAQPEHQRIVEFFGLTAADVPTVRLINIGEDMAKYKPSSNELTEAVLSKFAEDFLAGNLKKHLMSEKTPADWDAKPVKVLTGENFADVVLNPAKAVLVEFYAPWCGHCKQLAPIWDQLGELFAAHSDVVVAKMDSTANEVDSISVQSFPTIKFFPAGADKEGKDYSGGRDLKSLAEYLMEETGLKVDVSAVPQGGDFEDDHHEHTHDHGHHDGHDHQEL